MKKFFNYLIKIDFLEIILLINKNFKFVTFCTVLFAVIFYSSSYLSNKSNKVVDVYFEYNSEISKKIAILNTLDSNLQKIFSFVSFERLKFTFYNNFFSKRELSQYLKKKYPHVNDNQIIILYKDFSIFDSQKYFTLYSNNASFELIIREYVKYINNLTLIQTKQDTKLLITEIMVDKETEKIQLENFLSHQKLLNKNEKNINNNDFFLKELFEAEKSIEKIKKIKKLIENSEFDVVYIRDIQIRTNSTNKIFLISFLGAMVGFLFSLLLLIMKRITK